MTRKRRRRTDQPKKRTSSKHPSRSPRVTTPEGDPLVFAEAEYRHAAMDEIRDVLMQADDFDTGGGIPPAPESPIQFGWVEMDPDAALMPASMGQRILALLTLGPTVLTIETMSRQRLYACRRRVQELLGSRVRYTRTTTETPSQSLRAPVPPPSSEPVTLPPDLIAEIEDQMIRQWLDESIPALGGRTPRDAVKTAEGRRSVLDLIDSMAADDEQMDLPAGVSAPDYRKAKGMLGLE